MRDMAFRSNGKVSFLELTKLSRYNWPFVVFLRNCVSCVVQPLNKHAQTRPAPQWGTEISAVKTYRYYSFMYNGIVKHRPVQLFPFPTLRH